MAITRDLSTTFGTVRSEKGSHQLFLSSFEIDFSASGMSLAQNEIMRICTVSAGLVVLSAAVYVVTAETEITDIDIGITTGTTTSANLIDGITLASTGWVAGNVDLSATGGGVWATADSNILLTNKDSNTLDAAKIKVVLLMADGGSVI